MSIITLSQMAERLRDDDINRVNKFCIHGYPGSGKTLLAATVAKVPGIRRVYWADLEDGIATVLSATNPDGSPYFTEADLAKIIYMPIPDRTMLDPGTSKLLGLPITAESNALAARILLRHFLSTTPVHYHVEKRTIVPKATEGETVSWCLRSLEPEDALVIDSGSQLGSSIFSLALEANPDHNHGKKHWGEFTTNAIAALSALQAAKCTVLFLCHTLDVEADPETKKKAATVPWFGSGPFSRKVGHYFGNVVYLYTDSSYRSLSTPIKKVSIQAKSRFSIDSSLIANPTMVDLIGLSQASKEAKTHIGATKAASPAAKPTGPAKSGGSLIKRS